MRRADQGGGATRCARRSGSAVLGVLLSALVVAGPASAESPPAAPGPLPAAPAFHLRASNGYSVDVLAAADPKTGKGGILVLVQDRKSTVIYSTHAVVTDTSIEADLGALGSIDVDFVPSGVPKTERPDCGGKPITFEGGSWVGVIDFEGEHGYAEVHATTARDETKVLQSILCALVGGVTGGRSGGHVPGARLEAENKADQFEFHAMKNSRARPARLTASVAERRGPINVLRSVGVVAPPSAFDFDVPAGIATVEPPAPFSGRAEYQRHRGGRPTWRGNLSVDFPGRPDVALTGTGTHASLEGWVATFTHPARTS